MQQVFRENDEYNTSDCAVYLIIKQLELEAGMMYLSVFPYIKQIEYLRGMVFPCLSFGTGYCVRLNRRIVKGYKIALKFFK